MKNYLKDLEKELKKLNISDKEIKEIVNDHLEMLEEAKADGVSDEELNQKFGTPETIAKQIYADNFASKFESEVDPVSKPEQLKDYELFKAFPVTSDVKEFKVQLVSEDLVYIPYEGDSIQVFAKKLKNPEDYQASFVDGEFLLKRVGGKGFMSNVFGSNSSADFGLMVPMGLEYDLFQYINVSGDALVDKIVAKNIDFKTTSGDVEGSNLHAEVELKLTAVSGDFEVGGAQAKSLDISLVSGDLELSQAAINGDVTINTVSGDVEFRDVTCEHIKFRTVSGDFEGFEVYPDSVELKSVSGDFEIENKTQEKEIVITARKSVSGDVKIR